MKNPIWNGIKEDMVLREGYARGCSTSQLPSNNCTQDNVAAGDYACDSDVVSLGGDCTGIIFAPPPYMKGYECHHTFGGAIKVYLSTGSSLQLQGSAWASISDDGPWQTDQLRLIDLNGDGKRDLVYRKSSDNSVVVGLSTGTSFGTVTTWASPGGKYVAGQAQFADVNGDGYPDLIFRAVTSCALDVEKWTACTSGNNGAGASSAVVCTSVDDTMSVDKPVMGASCGSSKYYYHRLRICRTCTTSGLAFKVGLGTGTSFTSLTTWATTTDTYFHPGQVKFADLNDDGRQDLVYQTSANAFQVGLSTGTGFATLTSWASRGGSYRDDAAQFADVNGDGREDLVWFSWRGSNPSADIVIYRTLPAATPTDALTSVVNPLGGTTTVAYAPSTGWSNTYLPYVLYLCFPNTRSAGNHESFGVGHSGR